MALKRPVRTVKGVACPLCGSPSQVVTTWRLDNGPVARQRFCLNVHCGHKFVTEERVRPAPRAISGR